MLQYLVENPGIDPGTSAQAMREGQREAHTCKFPEASIFDSSLQHQARRQRGGGGGAMGANAPPPPPPPHGPKRPAWKEPKTKEKNAKDESFLLICQRTQHKQCRKHTLGY